ncbi:MAG TPA: winged helix-turn-helix domain-containing protein [Methanothrix sp.]|jgi:predicted transcriptional regulator|uniref:winged helix-turn-helix domain-containing protein n=1 Tax=Methanothrix sp. TaxID=90426 RepID=UPI001BD2F7B8|nr:winged helix-turn-helix domain-containing protein [Methanothrix sp.]MDI9418378.1 winged helix-turn-helix domain-containing protein [Euryarchaeota archaeon]HON35065.1 winged helix-turn-helix domain-containing protein [Methanothrix sp.]HRU75479.1 winged helix-turn-helix domain-containing protein [Methanothrix sp.]
MRPKRRTNDKITSDILKLCMNGASKTRIVYQANLNSASAKPYIENLINNGLVEEVPVGSKVIYKTTPKGVELSRVFNQFHSEMNKLFSCV